MLKLLVLLNPKGPDGCTWYRVVNFVNASKGLINAQYLDLNLTEEQLTEVFKNTDIFLARLSPFLPEVIATIREKGVKKPIVLDIDDSLENINPLSEHYRNLGQHEVFLLDGSPLWKDGLNGFSLEANKKRLEMYKKSIEDVDLVITTSFDLKNELEKYNKAVAVVPNSIDFSLFPNEKKDNIRLLWSGGASHYEDLAEVQPVLEDLMAKYPRLHLYMYGNSFPGIIKNMPKDRVHTKGWCSADAHGYRLASVDADISICPLRENAFNEKKSSIKYYEMSALGVPSVCRNMPPYSDDIVDGENGYLYKNNEEFKEKLEILINDPVLRLAMGQKAYEYVSKHRDVKEVVKDWVEIFERLTNVSKQDKA